MRAPAFTERMRVLVLSRNYPNNVAELMGLWVRGLVRQSANFCTVKVVSPVPYCPPIPGLPPHLTKLRRVERRIRDGGVESLHPRFLIGPGYSTHAIEWRLYHAGVRSTVDALRREFPFDLIHAHFTYPDGVVALQLGQRYRVPVVITEQNPWGPWMDRYPGVRRRAIDAAQHCTRYIAISQMVRRTIEQYAGAIPHLTVIPDGVNAEEFTLPPPGAARVPNRILFAGAIRPVKGVDVLLAALRRLVESGHDTTLTLVGEAFFGAYMKEELRLKQMVRDLGLAERVVFAGKQPLAELVRLMQESAALVLPSRAESLGMVLIEALACGTPVVATRCGGPEEIVNDSVGVLVPTDDADALARGIAHVLDRRDRYDPATLRAHAIGKFGLEAVGERLKLVYEDAVGRYREAAGHAAHPVAQGAASQTEAQLG